MANVTEARPVRTGITIQGRDGTVAVARRVADPTVFGMASRYRQYEVLCEPQDGYIARLTLTRPALKLVLRKSARIVGRVV